MVRLPDGWRPKLALEQLEPLEADAAIVSVVKELGGKRKTTVQPTVAPGIIPTEPEGPEKKHGRNTAKVSFQVPRETSQRPLQVKDEGMVPFGYRGRFWVDLDNQLVVRLESKSTDMPRKAPITDEELVLRYKEVMLVDKLVWLPAELHVIVKTDAMGDGGLSTGVLNAGGTPNFQTSDKTSLRWVSFFRKYRPFEPE